MPWLEGRRVLITGAAGFVGANLVRRLLGEGARVTCLVAPRTDAWRLADLDVVSERASMEDEPALRETLRRDRPDVVFSLAVARPRSGLSDAGRCLATNVVAVGTLLDAAGELGAKVVHLGSSTEYAPSERPLRESDPLVPTTIYGAAKAAGTMLCRAAAASVDVVVLRPFMVYGPWDHPSRFVPQAIRAAQQGGTLRLTPAGLSRDWIHVDDVVDACLAAAGTHGLAGLAINVGTGRQATPEAIASHLQTIVGPFRTEVGAEPPRPWDRECWVADTREAERLLGWRARVTLPDGLRSTFEWTRGRQHGRTEAAVR
jgi:nucleoside-diphosphate-sugar epimerase